MNKLFSTVCSFFGMQTDVAVKPERLAAKLREQSHDDFNTAVRAHDESKIRDMLETRRIGLGDELDRGRGLLQFAVMANSLKTVKLLMIAGSDGNKKDSLGATAVHLAKKNGGAAMMLAVAGKAA